MRSFQGTNRLSHFLVEIITPNILSLRVERRVTNAGMDLLWVLQRRSGTASLLKPICFRAGSHSVDHVCRLISVNGVDLAWRRNINNLAIKMNWGSVLYRLCIAWSKVLGSSWLIFMVCPHSRTNSVEKDIRSSVEEIHGVGFVLSITNCYVRLLRHM